MSVAEIKSAVVELPVQDRAELAGWLLDLLPVPALGDEDPDGYHEAGHRREELDSGQVAPLGTEQFWSDVDRARAQWK